MGETNAQRWFTAIPMNYNEEDARFWYTDGGALCRAFLQMGLHSRFVAWGEPAERQDKPLILCRPEQMQDPEWWKQWRLDGVMLTSWAAPRFEPIARAIKASGTRLVVRLDTDGLKSPRGQFRRYLTTAYFSAVDAGVRPAALHALAKSLAFRFVRSAYDEKFCAHVGHASVALVETPLARERLAQYFRRVGRPELIERLRVLPHPAESGMAYDPTIPKQPHIIAVGRWKSKQKDAPTLLRVLGQVLPEQPDYSAYVAGDGAACLERLRAKLPPATQERIRVLGPIAHDALERFYQQAQMIFFSSRYEGFPFAAAEALCCGCTVVGAATLPSMNYIVSRGAGTLAASRSTADFADALSAEISAWRAGERDPQQISNWWRNHLSAPAIAAAVLKYFAS